MKYKRLYLAYGSNINLEHMAQRCPHSKVIATDKLKNYELEFRGVATIVPKKGASVPVLLWEIDQLDEISLDRYEGFPRLYRKELFNMNINGKSREVMAYLMNRGEISPPTPTYYNCIKKGYEANGIDTGPLREALERSVEYRHSHKIKYFDDEELDEEIDEDLEEEFDEEMADPWQLTLD